MISSIEFTCFRLLRNTTLPLQPFTLILGPNSSGKSTALFALQTALNRNVPHSSVASADSLGAPVEVVISWQNGARLKVRWMPDTTSPHASWESGAPVNDPSKLFAQTSESFGRTRVFRFDPDVIAAPSSIQPGLEIGSKGENFAGVLDELHGSAPERWESLNKELHRWLPEYDRLLFDVPATGKKTIGLRLHNSQRRIAASDLSHGTLLCLAILTLAYVPSPPSLVAIEEPDRGIHPRLLREVRDALYRLSYPDRFADKRPPVQVIVTTHSPHFLDLFKDHPEEVVLAERKGSAARFKRLVDHPDLGEIIGDAPLGDVWYSGVLGGVPAKP